MLCTTILIMSSSDNGILMTYENNYLALKLERMYLMIHLKNTKNDARGSYWGGGGGSKVSYYACFGL